jgi:hypothetical protein
MENIAVLHTFTPDEKRVVDEAQSRLILTLEVIARCHGITEKFVVAPDGKALLKPPVEVTV